MATRDDVIAARPVAQALEALNVPYYLGGSVASSAHGLPRSTMDVDFVAKLREEHVNGLIARLGNDYYADAHMIRDAIQRQASFNLIHIPGSFKVDVFIAKRRPADLAAWNRIVRARPFEGAEDEFPISSPEDVILSKLEWYRLGGETSERQWLDILGVMKVQADQLDREYLKRWAPELGVSDLLQRALSEAAG